MNNTAPAAHDAGTHTDSPARHRLTSAAVGEAVLLQRQIAGLNHDELCFVLESNAVPMTPARLREIESSQSIITVDELMAFSYALNIAPAALLGHTFMAELDLPVASGLPENVGAGELREFIAGNTLMDPCSRREFQRETITRLELRAAHLEEHIDAARAHLSEYSHDLVAMAGADRFIRIHQMEAHEIALGLQIATELLEELEAEHHNSDEPKTG